MSWALCQQALDLRMTALPALDPALVAWPNLAFDPPVSKLHYRIHFIPAVSWAPYGTGTTRRFKGIYQVSVYAPIDKGSAALIAAVDAVCAHFDRLNLTRGAVSLSTEVPTPGPALIDGAYAHVPVSVPFYTR
jgi:Bacteriophage related domain of unknown function